MKSAVLGLSLVLSFSAFATVVEIENSSAQKVIEVYEEMQEQEEVGASSDNAWIHDFETEKVGKEMDHLSRLKRTAGNLEEM